MHYFYILTNLFNCLGYGNILFIYTIFMTLSTKIVFKYNKLNNNSEFYSKSIKYPQISLYNSRLKLLLGLNFKIIIIKYILAITTFLANVKLSNRLE